MPSFKKLGFLPHIKIWKFFPGEGPRTPTCLVVRKLERLLENHYTSSQQNYHVANRESRFLEPSLSLFFPYPVMFVDQPSYTRSAAGRWCSPQTTGPVLSSFMKKTAKEKRWSARVSRLECTRSPRPVDRGRPQCPVSYPDNNSASHLFFSPPPCGGKKNEEHQSSRSSSYFGSVTKLNGPCPPPGAMAGWRAPGNSDGVPRATVMNRPRIYDCCLSAILWV